MSIRRAQDERLEGTPDGLTAVSEIMDFPDAPTAVTATNVGTSRAYNNGAATVAVTPAATGGVHFRPVFDTVEDNPVLSLMHWSAEARNIVPIKPCPKPGEMFYDPDQDEWFDIVQ